MTGTDTIDVVGATQRVWDVVVIGAGPAGCLAARQCALAGLRTLLVEAKRFPRPKVCGGCLNGRALAALNAVGLAGVPAEHESVALHEFNVRAGRGQLCIALPGGRAVDRTGFDAELAHAAVMAGAEFLSGYAARVVDDEHQIVPVRTVQLGNAHAAWLIAAKVVVAADGLSGSSLSKLPGFRSRVSPHAYLGLGTQLLPAASGYDQVPRGVIAMAVDAVGYLGMVRLADGRLNIAAAVRRDAMNQDESLGQTMNGVLERAGFPSLAELERAVWTGTAPLTRSASRLAGPRLFVVGDAAGYVEPFTGEGVAFAVIAGILVSPFVERAIQRWDPLIGHQWEATYRATVLRRQWLCRGLSALVRCPRLVRITSGFVSAFPSLARHLVARLNRPMIELT